MEIDTGPAPMPIARELRCSRSVLIENRPNALHPGFQDEAVFILGILCGPVNSSTWVWRIDGMDSIIEGSNKYVTTIQ